MDELNDGGPAFPCLDSGLSEVLSLREPGMMLRDYFAAKARIDDMFAPTSGMSESAAVALVGSKQPSYVEDPMGHLLWWSDAVARWKYAQADAMLRARKQESPK